ncbi:unnamed protein product [Oikopleura dioica]|uniref:Uncharacterized protein n=1 Tax=Oikopleura dioica TaxID=34765 RepID=E4XXT6_OIKDI|nr:unnamed protein product [Oikopleura dioica]
MKTEQEVGIEEALNALYPASVETCNELNQVLDNFPAATTLPKPREPPMMQPVPEDEESGNVIFPLKKALTEAEFRQMATQLGLKKERACPSGSTYGSFFLGLAFGGMALHSAQAIWPCLATRANTVPVEQQLQPLQAIPHTERVTRSAETDLIPVMLPRCLPRSPDRRLILTWYSDEYAHGSTNEKDWLKPNWDYFGSGSGDDRVEILEDDDLFAKEEEDYVVEEKSVDTDDYLWRRWP